MEATVSVPWVWDMSKQSIRSKVRQCQRQLQFFCRSKVIFKARYLYASVLPVIFSIVIVGTSNSFYTTLWQNKFCLALCLIRQQISMICFLPRRQGMTFLWDKGCFIIVLFHKRQLLLPPRHRRVKEVVATDELPLRTKKFADKCQSYLWQNQ